MKTSHALSLVAFVGAALFAGCSTPTTRIKNDPAAFARLTPEQQALVQAGQVGVGFDMETVKLALGDPDAITLHTNAMGQTQVWHYVTYETYDGVVLYGGYGGYYRRGWRGGGYWGGGGPWGGPWGDPYFAGYPTRVHERFRVTFDRTGRVESVQQEM
jgi:outer membrane protein assembly factor BamE (lipoprotein component of BamABCDE complex)